MDGMLKYKCIPGACRLYNIWKVGMCYITYIYVMYNLFKGGGRVRTLP